MSNSENTPDREGKQGEPLPSVGGASRLDDGGPAFPQGWDPVAFQPFCGMSLRDYFTAKALTAWICCLDARRHEPGYSDEGAAHEAARLSILTADATLAARAEVTP